MKDLDFTDNQKVELIYDIFAGILSIFATLVVALQFSKGINEIQLSYLNIADKVIYIIFLLDFFIRLILSNNKRKYFRDHIFDFIAIVPFDFFTNSPYGSAFKLLKVLAYILRLIHNMRDLLYTNGFIYSLGSTVIVTLLGSIGIYIFEKDTSQTINSLGDAFWWSFVTVTTVGYGDISPSTSAGRAIACVLMLAGIGFLSMLTSTVSTYFITRKERQEKKNSAKLESCILDISDLDEEKRKQITKFYEFIKNS